MTENSLSTDPAQIALDLWLRSTPNGEGISRALRDDSADLEAVRSCTSSFFEAWNRYDVSAMAALYTDDAQVVNSLGL